MREIVSPDTKALSSKKSPAIVFHIQDVHGDKQAQENISSLLLGILEKYPNALIGLEGTAGWIPVDDYRHSAAAVRDEIGWFLFNTGYIAGPELVAFRAPKAPHLLGVEDTKLYLKNQEAVIASLARQDRVKAALQPILKGLSDTKQETFNENLLQLDLAKSRFEDGLLNLGEYLALLTNSRRELFKEYPQITAFLEAYRVEQALNYGRVERERAKVLNILFEASSKGLQDRLTRAH